MEQLILEGDLAEAQQSYQSTQRQLAVKRRQLAMLEVRAPARGYIVNWQLRQNLSRRPVQRGQNLMTLVAPDAHWSLELEMPERRIAHLINARRQSTEPLAVTFALASHPGAQYTGRLVEIQSQLDVRGDAGNVALVTVEFDEQQLDPALLKTGTRVTARVHAGSRSMGYVWLHELVETVQSRVLFWF